MKTYSLLRVGLALFFCHACSLPAKTQQAATPGSTPASQQLTSPLTAGQVIQAMQARNAERTAALESYTATRVYHIEYKGFPGNREAGITVHVKFTAPSSKQFTVVSETGSKFLIEHVLKRLLESEKEAANPESQRQLALNAENYEITLLRYETGVEDSGHYVLKLAPRTGNKFLYRGEVWVDAHDFAVTHIAAQPAKNPSFWITKTDVEHRYGNVSGFWLPMENRTVSKTRGGVAVLTIQYRDYKVSRAQPQPLLAHGAVQ